MRLQRARRSDPGDENRDGPAEGQALNGETVARTHTVGSRFGLGDLLAHASASERLVPGELFSIGALSAGSGMEISRWLTHGDTLELGLPGVGHITHRIK